MGSEAEFTPASIVTFNILIHDIFVARRNHITSLLAKRSDLSASHLREREGLKNVHATFQFIVVECFELLTDPQID